MAELRVVFSNLEKDAENEIRDRLLTFLKSVADNVDHAWFGGSPNGAPNFDLGDVKPPAPTAPATAPTESSAPAATPPATETSAPAPPAEAQAPTATAPGLSDPGAPI